MVEERVFGLQVQYLARAHPDQTDSPDTLALVDDCFRFVTGFFDVTVQLSTVISRSALASSVQVVPRVDHSALRVLVPWALVRRSVMSIAIPNGTRKNGT